MKIKYETTPRKDGDVSRCMTHCPHGKICKVGSQGCEACNCNGHVDREQEIVFCNFNRESSSINKLAEWIYSDNKKKGFWETKRSFPELLALMHSELSEALEDYRDFKDIDVVFYEEDGKPCGIPSELADVIIRVLDVCGAYNIDIDTVITDKLNYNKKRPYKHNRKC